MADDNPKRVRVRLNSGHIPTGVTCAVCGIVKYRAVRSSNDAGLCCSRACGFKLIRWRAEQRRSLQRARVEFRRWARRSAAAARHSLLHPGKCCRLCGVSVRKFAQMCDPCRLVQRRKSIETTRRSGGHRAAKARRRALERGIEAERFDPIEILSRDKWRCHICGCSTPRRLRGTFEPQAPELDHIVPLAAGGKHTRINTACACRRCNIAKGARILGQMRLVA
jgi:5-methylcytosine-specific restriction endonuclease McrA